MSGKAMHGKKMGRILWQRIQSAWRGRKSASDQARSRRNRLRFESLEERRVMTVNHAVDDHIHPYLKIFVNGSEVPIPANIGLGTAEYSPHTHDATGKLHIGEGLPAGIDRQSRYVTLKDFFDVWRTTNVGDSTRNNPNAFFDSTHLLDKVADSTHSVYMTVNGVTNTEYQNYIPEDGDQIILSYASNDGAPTLAAIPDATVLGGSPLLVPLDGFDPTNQQVTYTVTSSNPLVTPTLMTNEPSWRVKVEGFGDMVFQLFTNEAPRAANRVSTLANQGFYNGLTFHRIINNFVIQGGDPAGNGTGGSDLGNFDDTFNVDLQHNRTGILSYAKSSDDTNNSQFFITEGPQRHLDFNHSIFGLLTEGESVRDAISNVAANSSGVPTNTVFIDKTTIYNDLQNAVLKLKAAEGASGSADITVTARDTDGHTAVRTFHVTVTPDTVNGGPFLNDIPAIRTTVNTPAQFQLTSQDVEGNAVTYTAAKGDSLSSTVSVNATTGQVTATPPTDFVGVMKVRASVAAATGQPNDTGDKSDVQLVNVTVAPAAPTAVDLTTISDTGASNTDNITNLTAPTILITGVTNGSTVKLYNGTTLLGQTTSTGTSASITLSNLSAGSYLLTATQTVSDIESDRSASLNMVLDTTPPQITSTPPTTGKVNQTLVYDAGSPEEGNANFRYDLVSAPSGAVIDATTGVLSWMPSSTQAGLQQFGVRFTDAAGNFATQNLSVNVADADQVRLRVAVTDSSGNALSGVTVGQDFQLRGYAKDLRSAGTAQGVYAAYWDVTYATDMASVTGAIDHGSTYTVSAAGSTATAGLIDEVGGAAASLSPLGSSEQLVFSVPMKALKAGTLTFSGNPADLAPTHEVLLYGQDPAVLTSRQSIPEFSVTVASTIGANPDTFNVDEDSSQNTLDVLANDVPPSGGTLTVTAVGTPNHGGTVTIGASGANVKYTPAANYNGEETFTYSVTSGSETTTATVTVQVHPINDAPTAVADSFTVAGNSGNDILDVLQNDLITPDAGETLRVSAVGTPSHGTVTIGPNGSHVVYSPTNGYVGSDSFTYTVSDPSNATSTATATVTVQNPNTAPSAADDQFTVAEDSSQFSLNPLANDSAGANNSGATLTITAVGTPDKSGVVTIASDGKSLKYSPASNFIGTEKFTYTMSDGVGTATGTATVTVTNVNDPPNAADDTATAYKNGGAQTINVLSNDVSTPDPTETFTIQAVTQGAHGTVAIASDGKSLTYSPATDYTGADTFTYTINDGNGGTDTATVNVTVADFVPSSLSGNVYFDVNGDGTRQSTEAPIVGVTITLTGTPTGGQAITRTTKTDATGAYQFTGLAPGSYVITQTQPAFLPDGPDKVGSQGGTLANDQITITLAQNTQGTGNDFGEKRAAKMVTIHNFLARNTRQYLLSAVDSTGNQLWTSPGPGWTNYAAIQTSLSTSPSELHIQVDTQPSAPQTATLPTTDYRARLLDSQGSNSLYRIRSAPSDLTFSAVTVSPSNSTPVNPNSNGDSGTGGEGEGDATAAIGRAAAIQSLVTESSSGVSEDVLADLASQLASSGRTSAGAATTSTSSTTGGGFSRFLARRSLTGATYAQGVDQLLGQF